MRKLALAAAVVALIAALVWWLRRDAASSAEIAAPVQANAPSARTDSALALPASEPLRAEAARAAETIANVEPDAAAAAASPAAPGELELRGTITVADELGVEHPSEDGRLVLALWLDAGRSRSLGDREVAVAAGAWSTSIPADVPCVGLREIELGGRSAALLEQIGDPWVTLPIPSARTLELRARWLDATRLTVRAADTGLDLDSVEVIEIQSWPENDLAHPGEATGTVVHSAARSPAEIPARGERLFRSVYFVRAPGYAWGRIEIDPIAGGERLLELSPGGSLAVQIVGDRVGPGTVLRLRPEAESAGRPLLQVSVDGRERVAIESVPAGTYHMSAELGEWWSDPRSLGTVGANVRAGDRTQVELAIEPLVAGELVDVGGVVVLPEAWQLETFHVWVRLVDTPLHGQEPLTSLALNAGDRVEGSIDTYRWTVGLVQPGRYELLLLQLAYSIALEVRSTGRSDVRFEIPPPGFVSVRVIDGATGADAEIESVYWACQSPGSTRGGGQSASKNPDTGRWEFRAPQCAVEVAAADDPFAYSDIEVLVGPGTTEATLELSRSVTLLVILKDGSATVPIEESSDVEVDGAGGASSWGGSSRGARIGVTQPGRYRVRVPTPAGYLPIQEREVELEVGREVELVIQLVRKP